MQRQPEVELAGVVVKFPFKSLSSYGKARKRVIKALPNSPSKCQTVLAGLAEEILNITVPKLSQSKYKSPISLPNETVEMVESFYNKDGISRVMSGKADYVILKCNDGTKQHRQKRHMVMTLGRHIACSQKKILPLR